MVIEYSNLSYNECLDLYVDEFYLMFKNAYIERLMSTEDGRKHLEDCKRYGITKHDKQRLSERFAKKGGN